MSQNYSALKYEIEVKVYGEKINDVNSFVVFRCPISYTSSFSVLDISVEMSNYVVLDNDIRKHEWPEISLELFLVDPTKSDAKIVGERIRKLGTKQYIAINMYTNETPVWDAKYIGISLILVNPVLYYLNNTNSYNVILEDITPLGIINQFEGHLKSTYGSKTFDFKKVGESVKKNNYNYEQILVRLENDLIIPSWIIQNYKPFNTFSFYFFDDFYIDEKAKSDITAHLINLGDKEVFTKRDITKKKYIDVFMANKEIDTDILSDVFNELKQKNPSKIIRGSDMQFKFKKATGSSSVPKSNSSGSSQEIEPGRKIKEVKVTSSKTSGKPTEETLLYASDDLKKSLDRLEIVQKQISEEIEAVYRYYLRDAHLDFFNFGFMYNIKIATAKEYLYTPISIVNTFVRETGPGPLLTHNCHYQMIKFKGEQ
jgi:hypothetical protein